MFDTRLRLVVRDAWRHRARSLLIVLAVTLGLLGAGTVLDAWALVRAATATGYAASHPVAATLRVTPLDAGFVARVRALAGVAAVRARRTVFASLQAGGERKSVLLYALDDVDRPDIGSVRDVQGAWPPAPGEIAIERSSLDYAGAEVGGDVVLTVGEGAPVRLRVAGLVRDVALAPGWMEHVVYAYAGLPTLARLGVDPGYDEVQFTVADPAPTQAAVRRLAWRVKAMAEREGRHVGRIDVPVPGRHVHAAQMDSLSLVQGAFGVLTLLVCATAIVNLMAAILAGQRRELGVMKALGAADGQLAAQALAFAAALGLLAVAIALPLAAWLGRAYAGLQAEMLNFPLDGVGIPAWALLLQAAVGIGLPLLASAWPIALACRRPVMASLRPPGPSLGAADSRARRWLQKLPLARPQLLSLHNALRQGPRCALTLMALAVAGATFVGAGNVRIAVQRSVDGLFDAKAYDISLRVTTASTPRALAALAERVPGVALAEAWGVVGAAAVIGDGTVGNAFTLVALPTPSRVLRPALREGRWLRAGEADAMVAGSALLKTNPGWRVGQRVALLVDGKPVALRLAGIVDSGPDALAYIAQATGGQASLLQLRARARSPAAQLALVGTLRAALESRGVTVGASRLQSEIRRGIEDHLQMVVSFLGVMGWLMIVVGGIGLATTMSVAVLERRVEIGVLRAIGARRRAIVGMVQLEGLVMALLGWLLALPLSVPVSRVLGDAFGRIMFAVPTSLVPEAASSARWLALVVTVSVLACAWPARQALRMSVAKALR